MLTRSYKGLPAKYKNSSRIRFFFEDYFRKFSSSCNLLTKAFFKKARPQEAISHCDLESFHLNDGHGIPSAGDQSRPHVPQPKKTIDKKGNVPTPVEGILLILDTHCKVISKFCPTLFPSIGSGTLLVGKGALLMSEARSEIWILESEQSSRYP